MTELAALGDSACYADLFDRPVQRHEGRDFFTQQEMSADGHILAADREVVGLVRRVMRNMRMFEHTGQLPGGKPYSEQPAYMVELHQAYLERTLDKF